MFNSFSQLPFVHRVRETMDLCAGLVFCMMMIAIWLDDAGFWKWLGKKLQ
jgi:hypothetical protein